MKLSIAAALLLLSFTGRSVAAARWEMQYFLDADEASITFTDIRFPSAQRGLASGVAVRKGRERPVVLVTANGGADWTEVSVPESPRSLFCLDETACWMVTVRGIWFSDETGRSWKKLRGEQGLNRVYFLTRTRGWALGSARKLLETSDGGHTWNKVAAAQALNSSEERTVFYTMGFVSEKNGLIAARSEPFQHPEEHPDWMDPDGSSHRERPTLSIIMETRDGGATWTEGSASMFGRISKLATRRGSDTALALIEFDRAFEFSSEVFSFDVKAGKQTRILRNRSLAITDLSLLPDGMAVVCGFEPTGRLARTPVPGKVRILESSSFTAWTEMPVDYRAVAHRTHLAAVDRDHMWVATDTGMILRLVR